jgi:two-component system phosphate regulon sensor histidine kinase PhoR
VTSQPDLPALAARALRVVARGRTYLNLIYLLVSLPLAIVYLVVLLAAAVSGAILTVALGFGLLILVVGLVAAWGFALLERELATSLLGIDLPPLAPLPAGPPWARVRAHVARPETWRSLAFLLLKLPLGLFTATVAGVVVVPSILAILRFLSDLLPGFGLRGLLVDVPGALVGFVALVAVMHGANAVAARWSQVVIAMLGPSAEQRQVWEAQRSAEAADRKRRELIVNVSHELRTPIASIQGHLDSLLMAEADRPADVDPKRYLGVAAAETRRLSTLVNELLELARADTSELSMSVRPVDIVPIVRQVTATLAPLAQQERQVTLVNDEGTPSVTALADPDRLMQILANLVRNAINHTPQGGAVRLEVGADPPSHVFVAVSDTGTGIAPDDLERVFDRFYRTDGARSRDAGGFGLGLSIAKDLVEAMGGTIGATSEVGVGSTFRVRLKAAG